MLSPVTLTRLEKAAADNGFDRELARQGDWLGFSSTQAPLRLWLGAGEGAGFVAALSRPDVGRLLGDYGPVFPGPLPERAVTARKVPDIPILHELVRRAFQLSRTLPDELLVEFRKRTARSWSRPPRCQRPSPPWAGCPGYAARACGSPPGLPRMAPGQGLPARGTCREELIPGQRDRRHATSVFRPFAIAPSRSRT